MSLPFHLGLRYNRHMVSLIKLEGRSREVLGSAYPRETNPRAHLLTQWGIDAQSPRRPEEATINEPLSARAQAILSYQLNPTSRATLNGGVTPLTQSRRDDQSGVKQRLHVGAAHAVLHVDSRPGRGASHPMQSLPSTLGARSQHGPLPLKVR